MTNLPRHEWVAVHILPHEPAVRAWLRHHVRRLSTSDIDDLMQDAYARLWSVEYTRIANGRGYLFSIVRNLLTEQARRARIVPMERLGEIDALRVPSEEPGPDRRASAQEELARLERIVAQLPSQCRRAFRLQRFEHLSQREIAAEMKISEKTVERHLSVALARVLEEMKQDEVAKRGRLSGRADEHDTRKSKD